MKVKIKVWRQPNATTPGAFQIYESPDLSPNASLLEMLDAVNEDLAQAGQEPIAFESDCREGICGTCGLMINGKPHGPERGVATCQTYMRNFHDGDTILIEPFRAKPFPVVKDLIVNRQAFDRIMQAGGYVSVRTGSPRDANAILVAKQDADSAMDAAACIACGACVAACKNASAMLFVAAKTSHLGLLPQGQPERSRRALRMVQAMDEAGFGACTVTGSCEAVCPKKISLDFIARLNRDYLIATLKGDPKGSTNGAG